MQPTSSLYGEELGLRSKCRLGEEGRGRHVLKAKTSELVSPKAGGDEAFELSELYGETEITKDVPRVGSVPRQRRRARRRLQREREPSPRQSLWLFAIDKRDAELCAMMIVLMFWRRWWPVLSFERKCFGPTSHWALVVAGGSV